MEFELTDCKHRHPYPRQGQAKCSARPVLQILSLEHCRECRAEPDRYFAAEPPLVQIEPAELRTPCRFRSEQPTRSNPEKRGCNKCAFYDCDLGLWDEVRPNVECQTCKDWQPRPKKTEEGKATP